MADAFDAGFPSPQRQFTKSAKPPEFLALCPPASTIRGKCFTLREAWRYHGEKENSTRRRKLGHFSQSHKGMGHVLERDVSPGGRTARRRPEGQPIRADLHEGA